MKAKSLSRVQLLVTPWTAAYQAPPSMGFQARVLEWDVIAFSTMVAYEMPKLHNARNQLPPRAKHGEQVVFWVQTHVCLTSLVLSLYCSHFLFFYRIWTVDLKSLPLSHPFFHLRIRMEVKVI